MNKDSWKIKKLGEVCDVRDGTHDSPKYQNEGFPLITSKNLTSGEINFENANLISEKDFEKINKRSQVDIGDILMPMIGTIGNPIIVKTSKKFAIKNVALIKFKPSSGVLNNFIHSLLKSNLYSEKLLSLNKGGTQKFIALGTIRSFLIPVPPLPIQEQIVAELDALNDILTKKRQQLAELDTLAQATFYEMFDTQNEKWENTTIENVCVLKSGKSLSDELLFKEGIYPYVKVSDMNNINNIKYITYSSNYCTHKKEADIIPKGSIIFPKRGGAIATNKKRITAIDIYADLNTMAVIPSVKVNKHFIYQYFINLDLGKLSNGAAIPQINNGDINPLPVLLPPLPLQNQFAERIEAIEKQKELIEKSIKETQLLFDYTMDKYFN